MNSVVTLYRRQMVRTMDALLLDFRERSAKRQFLELPTLPSHSENLHDIL